MPPGDEMNSIYPGSKFFYRAKPIPKVVPIAKTNLAICRAVRFFVVFCLFLLPVRVISVDPRNNKIDRLLNSVSAPFIFYSLKNPLAIFGVEKVKKDILTDTVFIGVFKTHFCKRGNVFGYFVSRRKHRAKAVFFVTEITFFIMLLGIAPVIELKIAKRFFHICEIGLNT